MNLRPKVHRGPVATIDGPVLPIRPDPRAKGPSVRRRTFWDAAPPGTRL